MQQLFVFFGKYRPKQLIFSSGQRMEFCDSSVPFPSFNFFFCDCIIPLTKILLLLFFIAAATQGSCIFFSARRKITCTNEDRITLANSRDYGR